MILKYCLTSVVTPGFEPSTFLLRNQDDAAYRVAWKVIEDRYGWVTTGLLKLAIKESCPRRAPSLLPAVAKPLSIPRLSLLIAEGYHNLTSPPIRVAHIDRDTLTLEQLSSLE